MEQAVQIPFKGIIQQDEKIHVDINKCKNFAKITCKNGELFAETDVMRKLNIEKFDETELKDLIKPNHLAVAGDLSSAKSEKVSHKGLNAEASTPVPSSMGSQGDSS